MSKTYTIVAWFLWILFYTFVGTANAWSACQPEYNKINDLKIELANLQEQYVWWKIEKEIQALYPWSPYTNWLINAKYQEWADKEAVLIVQINKQIAIYESCVSTEKESAKIAMDNAKSELDDARNQFSQTCYKMNAVPNSTYTNCECVLGTSYSTSAWKCISQKTETAVNSCSNIPNGYTGTDGKCYCTLGYSWDTSANSCKNNNTISNTLRLKAQIQFDKYEKQYSQFIQSVQKSKYQSILITLKKKSKTLKWDNQKINNLLIELITIKISKI